MFKTSVLISYKVYLVRSQTVGVKTNCVFQNLRVFNHAASSRLLGTNHTLLINKCKCTNKNKNG